MGIFHPLCVWHESWSRPWVEPWPQVDAFAWYDFSTPIDSWMWSSICGRPKSSLALNMMIIERSLEWTNWWGSKCRIVYVNSAGEGWVWVCVDIYLHGSRNASTWTEDAFLYYDIGTIREIGSIVWVSHGESGGLIDPGHYNVCLRMHLGVGSQSECLIQAIDPNARRIRHECAPY